MSNQELYNGVMGGLVGAYDQIKKPAYYYTQSQWKGNGLADTGLGYFKNYTYKNPYDIANILSTIGTNNTYSTQSKTNNIKNKLGGMVKSLLGNDNQSDWYNSGDNDYYNTLFFGNDDDNYNYDLSNYYSTSDKYGNFDSSFV